ncbi:hypothetical protein F5Y08DRAFT_328524 [Xylaria arbuscula]|nr:hypothetical protein F5Y08DRAFT_328524 [Xylaria arbuscula]
MHANEILQVCSYHRRDFDLLVIRSRPHEMQRVQASLPSAFETLPTADMGILDCLPPELITLVLHELDLRSFFSFRQVNRQSRIVSTSLWEYKLVSQHGLEGLRGLLRAELASYFTISDLYRTLTTDKCSTCGAFGGHLFLFTAERCCFKCLVSSSYCRVLAVSTFAKIAHLSLSRVNRLLGIQLRTVPGIYNMLQRPVKRPKYLIFEEKATQILLTTKAIGESAVRRLAWRREQVNQRFMTATAYPYYSLEDAKLERGVSCKGCQIRDDLLYGAIITKERVLTTRGFLSHFSHCVEAQNLWTESEKGTRLVNEPQITRDCGYFNKLGSDGLPT